MSTRTFTLNFLGAGMLPLPQGRYFMVLSASDALTIRAVRRDGQPVEFIGVGAGLQYSAQEGLGWYVLEVESAVAQAVKLVISDEGTVSVANAVTVLGNPEVSIRPSTVCQIEAQSMTLGQSVTITPVPQQLRVRLKARASNTASLFVKASPGGGSWDLAAGQELELITRAALIVEYPVGSGTQAFSWIRES